MWNHGVITRGLVDLLRILPPGHPFGPDPRASLIAATNRSLRLQAPSGEVRPNARVHGDTVRESPTFGAYSTISTTLTREADSIWVHASGWAPASITVDSAEITDAGLPLPEWDPALDSFERHQDMMVPASACSLGFSQHP